MKYCRFLDDNQVKYGMVDADRVIELVGSYNNEVSIPTDRVHFLNEVQLLCPVDPKQVIAIGLNYSDHAKEQNKKLPEEPMMFMVSPSAVIGPNDEIQLARDGHRIDYEAELAIVIGKEAKDVGEEDASSYIFGYTCANDISDRDLQKKDGQFTRAKSFRTYKPIGPWIETNLNPQSLSVRLKKNGEVKQDGTTKDMIHSIEKIIAAVTEVMTLYPGDVILTGTPAGVGPLCLGDEVEIDIDGIGQLRNKIIG
ncbi:2-keto-4-pentenoate hydratase/2-oxohepta-3-ene-1,7-dioic acid hydratase in catechol pathway [Scopulibacillus darangshiensis]|uniref:2-keto-4-pentenoate hydratase/2-oxohepta-3-ene-1,7-dioic acid hydratase in catechol pathway n=1 Tax=Scopulibacillus darangshiensis TaxID=442528 RepID=A0A4R2NWZ4_9BACL|nr:fumarylacetoacetate hydrolase family protein [Scopulibacillus darangshiensis]TCP26630.1 2-keto-4-pentenoate hydratase/2-oxohepta-3-ene-1,7-dioic acid hydratase in catechol pathway [Scopulibacillus darangshiensis]